MNHDPFFSNRGGEQTLVERLVQGVLQGEDWIWIQVVHTQGSVPRAVGTWMAVSRDQQWGTIGGGHLEFQAIARAQALLAGSPDAGAGVAQPHTMRLALGPSLGQCCGGVVELSFVRLQAHHAPNLPAWLEPRRRSVALFGGGHVGHALVAALMPLPYRIHWIDSRVEIFPTQLPPHVCVEHSDPVSASVWDVPPDSAVLIMSFSHAEDLDIVAECLKRRRTQNDLPFVGLIGSKTKWATFQHRLEARGFDAQECAGITCPIGILGIQGKEPEVIAASVAAQLLMVHRTDAAR